MMENKLLGVKVDYPFVKKDFESLLEEMLSDRGPKFIFTINPEFIVDSSRDSNFKSILNKGYFNSADGIGVVFAMEYQHELSRTNNSLIAILNVIKKYLKGTLVKKRFTGVEITEKIFEYADKNFCSVFLLGGDSRKMVSEKLLLELKKRYTNIQFLGASSAFLSKPNDDQLTRDFITECMKKEKVTCIDFILVGYGHPYQEKWIERNHDKLNVKILVGVGGTFDFLSGNVKRAPSIFQKIGIEWLFRLFIQPKRFLRILKATVGFSYLIFTKIKH